MEMLVCLRHSLVLSFFIAHWKQIFWADFAETHGVVLSILELFGERKKA
jgi:hypothetical protein